MENQKFAVEIAKYFRDFLETNFHKRKVPKRSFQTKSSKNLLIGVSLKSHDHLKTTVLKSVANSLKNPITVEKGKYTEGLAEDIIHIIQKFYSSINPDVLVEFENEIQLCSKHILDVHSRDIDEAKDRINEVIKSKLNLIFIQPLFELIETFLRDVHSYDDDSIQGMREELISIMEEKHRPIVSEYVIGSAVEKKNEPLLLTEALPIDFIKEEVNLYFESLKTSDVFFKLNELINNLELIDNQQLYLYIFDIKFEGDTYPLFYVPIEATKTHQAITLTPDANVYVNKKAVDFIIENYNQFTSKQGKIKSSDERVINLSDTPTNLEILIENLANEILNYCEIDGVFSSSNGGANSFRGQYISVSNSCYFALFDKSDEALVNDYEELISLMGSSSPLGEEFCALLQSFLKNDPISVTREVESEWEETNVSEKLVNISPISLNEEQNQILAALRKETCRYIAVQGPPGTGKSHTITAIVFRMILEKKNVLVLSDKKEALDVVEDKITETLDRVRFSEEFQNPILRLGRAGNTYSKILSDESLQNINNHLKAVNKNKRSLSLHTSNLSEDLKNKINDEVKEYRSIQLSDIALLEKIEKHLEEKNLLIVDESECHLETLAEDLESIYEISADLAHLFGNPESDFIKKFNSIEGSLVNTSELKKYLQLLSVTKDLLSQGLDLSTIRKFKGLNRKTFPKLKNLTLRLNDLSRGYFGYFFKGKQLAELLKELHTIFDCPDIVNLRHDSVILNKAVSAIDAFENELEKTHIPKDILTVEVYSEFLSLPIETLNNEIKRVSEVIKDLEEVREFLENYPGTSKNLNLIIESDITNCLLNNVDPADIQEILNYYSLKYKIESTFERIPEFDYNQSIKVIQDLYTSQMTHILDESVINFAEKYSAKAKSLKKIISGKKLFPREEFELLREAFPCIVASIRDYAEYIPLDQGIFDLVIIDEASQVSIAQALPAILRAKKVIVFGDKRQFSNIKAAQAKSIVNQQYVQNVKNSYLSTAAKPNQGELERLSRFNVKTSVLDFFEYICHYKIMLRKHFRGYRELISYSSKYFYQDHLQAIKIRGKKIEDVLDFKLLNHDGRLDSVENANLLEIDEIIKYLENLNDEDGKLSIGVITPHTNQQKLIFERISTHPRYEDLQSKNKIKIMTFDTCQGEERDIIIYSMVAHPGSDKLSFIFIRDLADIDFDEENKIKAQRLNVGFSRAKEKMVFFLSKPIGDFAGTIGDALRHYKNTLEKAKDLPVEGSVDPKSPMEKKVLNWIQETSFFKENLSSIELKAQFPIGEYLKQLSPTYKHPNYVCDFLLLFKDEKNLIHKVILEYDGFKEHFSNLSAVGAFNFESYYTDQHVFREKILEGYGYKFIRINKFNVGKDPIDTLDSRLRILMKNSLSSTNPGILKSIHLTVSSLEDGSLKECSKCNCLKPLEEFKDKSLVSGIGRVCRSCKARPAVRKRDRPSRTKYGSVSLPTKTTSPANLSCPACGSQMVQRSGRYGQFLGCAKYPLCKGTRKIA